MLFWIFLSVLILSIILTLVFCDHDCCFIFISTTIVSCLAIIISLAILMCNHLGVDGYVSQMNTRYEMLTYQYENDVYENDNDIGKRELITDIQSWNEDLAWYRENQRDLWIGVYIPNIYDQFEFISLDKKE